MRQKNILIIEVNIIQNFFTKNNKILGGNKMDYREIKENKLKFDSYVEDRFVLMGKRMLNEYKEKFQSLF